MIKIPTNITYHQLRKSILEGTLTCRGIVEHYLDRIRKFSTFNIVIEVFEQEALTRAEEIDEKVKSGAAGKLAGMVVGIKDNLLYQGHEVTAASRMLRGFRAVYNSTVVQRLLDEDAIIIGRLNCDEFAMGSSNERSAYGVCKNPVDPSKVPGGSSGGSAAAVKAGLCMVSLGSDTGGSIRQPAAFCGVIGLKPTYGLVSRYGLVNYTSTFDQIGPLANSIHDIAAILEVIAGKDEKDQTLADHYVPEYTQMLNTKDKASIAVFSEITKREGLDPEIKNLYNTLINKLAGEGHKINVVNFPYLDYLLPAYTILTSAEASSNLARYDGVHYHRRTDTYQDIGDLITKSRSEGFGAEPKRKILMGKFVLGENNYEQYYLKAQKVRRLLRKKTDKILSTNDFILMPTTPTTAFNIGEIQDVIVMYLQDIFTTLANHTGNPAISLPLFSHPNGLPVGMQVMGKRFGEAGLLAFSEYLMKI